jgi:hypothetical protein
MSFHIVGAYSNGDGWYNYYWIYPTRMIELAKNPKAFFVLNFFINILLKRRYEACKPMHHIVFAYKDFTFYGIPETTISEKEYKNSIKYLKKKGFILYAKTKTKEYKMITLLPDR